jgi:gas vesicle protein
MRIRTLFTFTTGAAAGAAAVYLFDPAHGDERRRQAARWAAEQARDQVRNTGALVLDQTRQSVAAATQGYREAASARD